MIKSCYVHIPFCKTICSYCDFCKNYYNKKIVLEYLNALDKEVESNYKKEKLKTLYVGGGTPSCLDKEELEVLFKILNKFNLDDDYEFTFECNYDDITEDKLKILKENKVNRLSIGIQTFNNKYEKFLNRQVNKEEMIDVINLSKKYFDNVNIDLMYALSNQTIRDLKEDLEIIKDLDINHVSTYSLIIEEHTNLSLNNTKEVSDELSNDMYYMISNYLKDNGFIHYELSNFSKPGYESKHNLTYWNNDNYYGFGAGASGFINNIRYDNTKSVLNYVNNKIRSYEETLDKEQLINDEIMLNLRKTSGINKKEFSNKYNISLEDMFDYKKLVNDNLLTETKDNVFIKEDKLYVSNEIILMFLEEFNNGRQI